MMAFESSENLSDMEDESADYASYPYTSPMEIHPPISPATPAESLFLAGLHTQNISASALAQEIRKNIRSASFSGLSIATDDFATAVACSDDIEDPEDTYNLFGRDVLLQHTREPILETATEEDNNEEYQDTMASNATVASPAPAEKDPLQPEEEKPHFDAASHVYEGAKGVWGWGKGVILVSPFLGLAECIASKVVGIAGTSLPEIDGHIKPHISELDDHFLNPAINAVVGLVLGAVGKTQDVVKPVVYLVLKPVGLIKDDKSTPAADAKAAELKKEAPESTHTAAAIH